ncbi:hypothetical protein [Variovorax ginsengisoli]|uniref:Uncharacterized protein n=1 Tax=Variovorax ginsengisoli TaxID=363844 RepID=A0ABT8S280_9BURK|nr:hypothetical protein [Variovorax ginsengisoli]MDN8613645.1 hypothetical protein [Variovorax ginsengisoli]MDO1532815.1 hypothetical protein [Variovorax ginsengisoli]
MNMRLDDCRVVENLEDIDREIARMATLCHVKLLQPGVIERVLQRDASVCGTENRIAFGKLHDMLVLHFAVREHSAEVRGQIPTAAIESYLVECLRKRFPELAAEWRRA